MRLSRRQRWMMALPIALVVLFAAQNISYQHGKAQWESLGDAHFYAKSAESWYLSGSNQWFELYPIALSESSGIHMAFGAPGHSLASALPMMLGFSAQESVLLLSSFSMALLISLFFCWMVWKGKSLPLAFGAAMSFILLSSSWSFASSGGSDALGMLCFALSLMALLSFPHGELTRYYFFALFFCVLGSLVRPQNQILLLTLPIWVIFQKEPQIKFFAWWLGSIITWKLLQLALLQGETLSFPYSFSFLVGTAPYPGHHLFREYFSQGFGLSNVWEQNSLWINKLDVGWRLLKQYWTGWLPGLFICLTCICSKKTRPCALQQSGVLSALILLSATGHLVPRYWTFMQPMVLILLFSWVLLFFDTKSRQDFLAKVIWLFPLVIFGGALWQNSPWLKPQPKRDLHLYHPPVELLRQLSAPWVTCDQPSKLIDRISKPILLLPNSVELLKKIDSEVQRVSEVLLSPHLENGELKHWVNEQKLLLSEGFKLIQTTEGWKLYRGTFKE